MEMEEFMGSSKEEEEIIVQQAVVESLAADKAEQDELIENQKKNLAEKETEIARLKEQIAQLEKDIAAAHDEIAASKKRLDENKKEIENVTRQFAESAEVLQDGDRVTLLERNAELSDNFEGETHDHVLEVLRDAQKSAEENGHLRRAQLLEGVLIANEPTGTLAERRGKLEQFFNQNFNVMNGDVIKELEKQGITYKVGENYLLLKDIIKRVY